MRTWMRPLGLAMLVSGCSFGGCEIDPCENADPPRFYLDDEPIETVRFPSDGSVEVEVIMTMDAEAGPGRIEVSGPFSDERRTLPIIGMSVERYGLEIHSVTAGAGSIEAADSCGRKARIALESVPVASFLPDIEIVRAIDRLPPQLGGGGVALLPGMAVTVLFEKLDARGEKLAGESPTVPSIEVTGGLRAVEPVKADRAVLAVTGPAGRASIRVNGVDAAAFDVADGTEGVRLETWRNGAAEGGDWTSSWTNAAPIAGTLDLTVGESAWVALHPFAADGRLLVGADLTREPAIDPAAAPFLSIQRGYIGGDLLITADAPGEAALQVQKAGATGTLQVRVAAAPSAP